MTLTDKVGFPATLRLTDGALRAYAYAVDRIRFYPEELAEGTGLDVEAADQAIAELLALRLLTRVLDSPRELTPVPPESAASQLLPPMEQELHRRELAVDAIRRQLRDLVPQYEAGAAHRRRTEGVELITDLTSVRGVIQDAARRCVSEVLTIQPGGGRRIEVLEEAMARDEEMLERGVSMRTVYQHTARYSRPTLTYVDRVTQLGAKVRTSEDRLRRMLIFDRIIAVIEVQDDSDAALVIREANIIEFMRAVFDQTWLRSIPFASSISREQAKAISDQLRQVITSLLAEGLNDKAIARRLGMSERTCQRHISEIMAHIGAKSRFQAGYLLRDLQQA
ncbi:LuxR C-terminal-related transcriptional regulator [Streptomyces sp. NPDC005962]|uniref:LuxR C-terminal-related transcriptional regulator n=1 Tax=Streptomyces sp. NPDC005962 TaxID=3154466 RepID=UPI0033E07F5F